MSELTELDFYRALKKSPGDDELRLVYADWLEAHGDPRHHYLRLDVEVERLSRTLAAAAKAPTAASAVPTSSHILLERSLALARAKLKRCASQLPLEWVAFVARAPLVKCASLMEFTCPLRWESLALTQNPNVRFCRECQAKVYFCRTRRSAYRYGRQFKCVALAAISESQRLEIGAEIDRRSGPWMGVIDPNYLQRRQSETSKGAGEANG